MLNVIKDVIRPTLGIFLSWYPQNKWSEGNGNGMWVGTLAKKEPIFIWDSKEKHDQVKCSY